MSDLADLYEDLRAELAELIRSLPEEDLRRDVPATPGWTIRDIAAHLAGDAASLRTGDYPREYFQAFGEADAVVGLNKWTGEHVSSRAERSLEEVLSEWEDDAKTIAAMMRGDEPWPEDVPIFADRVLLTDLVVHQQDIYGALGKNDKREAAPVRIAAGGYIAVMGFRLDGAGIPPLALDTGDKTRIAGSGDPAATVRISHFELFRALSGRRSPEQIAAYDWDGDPEPYIPYFYPYEVREEALVE